MKSYASFPLLSKLTHHMVLASAMLVGSVSAQAMLPTPEPEMNNPSTLASAAVANQAQRSTTNQVETKTVAALVSVDAQGQRALKPIDANTRLQKGNVIEYHTYVTNHSPDRMRKMTVTTSIPAEVKLVGEVAPDTASASVDGSNFSRMPLRGRINGQLQDVPLEYYKHLRWTIEGLGIEETAVMKYRAVVR